ALPPDSYIFLILLLRDATGVTHNADEALQRIHAAANAPINGIFQHQLGLGIVGGRLYQAELEGIESARIAVRILHGEPASSFPPTIVGPLSPRYDWRELQRRIRSGSRTKYVIYFKSLPEQMSITRHSKSGCTRMIGYCVILR